MKKLNWKNVIITILSICVFILLVQNILINKDNKQLESELLDREEEIYFWYSEYKITLNELYNMEVKTGRYIEDIQ